MNTVASSVELRAMLDPWRCHGRIALVPTMGCLHAGHTSLIRQARKIADRVVVSIYVNPLQFGASEDLDSYPRTLAEDRAVCEREGVDILFHPASLYPANGSLVTLKVTEISDIMCGVARPGHFDGVVTVVNILFNIVQPDFAMFGDKDWQQLMIIRRMVNDLGLGVEVMGCETVREADGLAMSSRNRYLSESERDDAALLRSALIAMRSSFGRGEVDIDHLLGTGNRILTSAGVEPEYLDIREADSLKRVDSLNKCVPARIFVAARIGPTRLIDNIALENR